MEFSSSDSDVVDEEKFVSLETNLSNVMKLQKLLQTEKQKSHKEMRSRMGLQQENESLHIDKETCHKKIEILSTENLELEKTKMQLELKIKNLELLLKEEKARCQMFEEKYKKLKSQYDQNGLFNTSFSNEENSIVKMSSITTNTRNSDSIRITQLQDELKEQQAMIDVKQSRWLTEKTLYEKEIAVLKEQLRCDEELVEESSADMADKMSIMMRENSRLMTLLDQLNIEMAYLKKDLENKKATILNLQQHIEKIVEGSSEMVSYSVVETLRKDAKDLMQKLQEKDLTLVSKEEEKAMIENKLLKIQSDLVALQSSNATLKGLLGEKDTVLLGFERDLRKEKDKVHQLEKSLKKFQLNDSVEIKETKIEKNETLFLNTNSQLNSTLKDNAYLKIEIERLKDEIRMNDEMMDGRKMELKGMKDQISALQIQVKSSEEKIRLLEEEVERLGKVNRDLMKVKNELQISLKEYQEKIRTLTVRLKTIKKQGIGEENLIRLLQASNFKLKKLGDFVQLNKKLASIRKILDESVLNIPNAESHIIKDAKLSENAIKLSMETHYNKLLNTKLKQLNKPLSNLLLNAVTTKFKN